MLSGCTQIITLKYKNTPSILQIENKLSAEIPANWTIVTWYNSFIMDKLNFKLSLMLSIPTIRR